MTVANTGAAKARPVGDPHRDHLEVFREFLDRLGRIANRTDAGRGTSDAGARPRLRSPAQRS